MSKPRIHVLHVDDEPNFADVTADLLEREDERLNVEIATDASEGFERLTDGEFDCVVSDYNMPEQNGIEFLEAVRAEYPQLPFILFTGRGSEEVASEAISAGVTDYMQKESGTDQYAVLANRIKNSVRQYRAEQETERTKRRLQELTGSTTDCRWIFSSDWDDLLYISGYEEVWDRPVAAIKDDPQDFLEGVHPDDRQFVRQAMEQLSNGNTIDIEYRILRGEDTTGWVWVKGEPVFDDAGNVVRVVGLTRDITERKEHEQELEQYEAYLEGSTDIITVLDDTGVVQYQSPSVTRILGYEPGELLGEDGFDLVHPDDREDLFAMFSELVSDPGGTVTSEARFKTAADEWRWLEVNGQNYLDHPGIGGVVTNNRDITDRKTYQHELEQTNALLSTLFETLPVGVLAEDESRNVLAVNQRLFELLELPGTPEEVVGADCERLAEDISGQFDSPEAFRDRIETLVNDREPIRDERVRLEDGRTFNRQYEPIELPDGAGHLWVYTDTTNQKIREERLEALNETTQKLMSAESRQQVAEIGAEAARDTLDMAANAIHLYDDDQSALVPVAVTETGRELVGEPPSFTEGDSIAWRVYEEGESLAIDDIREDSDVYNPDSPVRSELHFPIGDYGILITGSEATGAFDQQDVVVGEILANNINTALEQVEQTEQLRDRERELTRQNDRLEEFVSVVSHDLQNPLRVVEGRMELLKEECESEQLDAIERALRRMDNLINDLLTLARKEDRVKEREQISLTTITKRCWQNVKTGEAALEVHTEQTIQADRSRLKQVFENLIYNAVEHGGDGVTVSIGDLDEGFYIADDGSGIPEDEREQIFEMGYSTRDEGTGFGLPIVKDIIEEHGWDIELTESDGGGAQFEITNVDSDA